VGPDPFVTPSDLLPDAGVVRMLMRSRQRVELTHYLFESRFCRVAYRLTFGGHIIETGTGTGSWRLRRGLDRRSPVSTWPSLSGLAC